MTTAEEANAPTPDELVRDTDPSGPTADSPGQQLRRAREARGLAVSQMATSLRIAPQVVDALEQDDYARLPSAVFVSGYIRSYARLVGLDPEPLNQGFRRLHPHAEPPPRHVARSENEDTEHEGGGLGVSLVAVLVVLAIAAGGYGWWVSRPGQSQAPPEQAAMPPSANQDRVLGSSSPASRSPDQAPEQAPLPAPTSSTETGASAAIDTPSDAASMGSSDQRRDGLRPPQPPSPDVIVAEQGDQQRGLTSTRTSDTSTMAAGEAAADAVDASSSEASGGNVAARAPVSTSLPVPAGPDDERPAVTQVAPSSTDNATTGAETETSTDVEPGTTSETATGEADSQGVVLSFSGTCWVDIRDSTGEVLLFGEMSRGDREILGGEPPYSLVLGNAAAAELTVAGEPYDLDSVARGNVARFDLDPSEFTDQTTNPSPGTAVDLND